MRQFLVLAALTTGLAGCSGDVERTFGLTRDAPDEFTVTTRAPLSMPPEYTLKPPQPGANRPQELSTQQAAEAALAPDTALSGTPAGPDSPGQDALVAQAGPPAPAGIRDQLNQEAVQSQPHQGLAEQLMFWRSAPQAGTVIDPAAESQRLRQNAALGQAPTVGDTAILHPQKSSGGFLGIF